MIVSDDHEIPSPLVKIGPYKNKLSEYRKWDEPPRPGKEYLSFIFNNTQSEDYDEESLGWWRKQIELDRSGMDMLAKHYGISYEQGSLDFWEMMSMCLARHHVAAFRMTDKVGRKGVWSDEKFALLQLEVIGLKKGGRTQTSALSELSPKYRMGEASLLRRLRAGRKRSKSPGSFYNEEYFKAAAEQSIEAIEYWQQTVSRLIAWIETEESKFYDK